MPRQLCCLGMCKFLLWSDQFSIIYSHEDFDCLNTLVGWAAGWDEANENHSLHIISSHKPALSQRDHVSMATKLIPTISNAVGIWPLVRDDNTLCKSVQHGLELSDYLNVYARTNKRYTLKTLMKYNKHTLKVFIMLQKYRNHNPYGSNRNWFVSHHVLVHCGILQLNIIAQVSKTVLKYGMVSNINSQRNSTFDDKRNIARLPNIFTVLIMIHFKQLQ